MKKFNPLGKVHQPAEIIEQIKDFSHRNNHTGFLFLAGLNGTGKTFIAKTLYWHKTGRIYPECDQNLAIFWPCSELKQKVNSTFFDNKNDIEHIRENCKKTELLIIDDIGANNMELKGFFSEFLYSIIDHRYENRNRLGTILTTNMNAIDFGSAIGHGFLTRVASDIVIRFDGPDRRFDENYKKIEVI